MNFDAERFRMQIRDSKPKLGRPLLYQPSTGSTNDDALSAARSGAPHGSLFVADEQTRGRGRRGNTWLAAPGESLLFSVLLRPELELNQVSALTLAIGLALRDAIAPLLSAEAQLKWPNDLYVAGKKLAGVLVESQLQGDRLQAVVVGVGLNVTSRDFPHEIAARATSLALLGATRLEREPLLSQLLEAIAQRLDAYQRTGVAGILGRTDGRRRAARQTSACRPAQRIGSGFNSQGHLLLCDETGHTHAISSGTVELL